METWACWKQNTVSEEKRLRFRIRRGDLEVELEGDLEYVRTQYEKFSQELDLKSGIRQSERTPTANASPHSQQDPLEGIIQFSNEGRPHLTVPADSLSAKEALSLVLYAAHPRSLGDDELSGLLGSSWKTTTGAIVRARASELKREGKLIAERGSYTLSGAGVQWVKGDLLPTLRKTITQ